MIEEREDGVEINISRKEEKKSVSSFSTQGTEEFNLSGLSVEQALTIVELIESWLDSRSKPLMDRKIDNVVGVHTRQQSRGRSNGTREITKQFNSFTVSVGEQAVKFSYWEAEAEEWKDVSIPSAEAVKRGMPTDYENVNKLYETFFDFFNTEHSDDIDYFADTELTNTFQSEIFNIEQMFERFSEIIIPLQERQAGKEPLTMDDEADVQYLLNALLKLQIDDVRREPHTERHSSVSPRIDFLLQDETIGIEVKRASSTRKEKALRTELAEDKEQYRLDTNVDTLLVFVYDPDKEITNKAEFEASFEQDTSQMTTRVTVTR